MTWTTLVLTIPFICLLLFSTFQYVSSEHQRIETAALEAAIDLGAVLDRNLASVTSILSSVAETFRDDGNPALLGSRARRALSASPGDLLLLDGEGADLLAPGPRLRSPFAPAAGIGTDTAGTVAISDLLPDVPGFGRRIVVSVPVTGADKAPMRLVLALEPAYFKAILLSDEVGPSTLQVVVDRTGTVIAASGNARREVGQAEHGLADIRGSSATIDAVGIDASTPRRYARRSVVTDWLVVTSASKSSLHAPLWRSVWLLSGVTFLLVFVVVPAAVVLTRRMRIAATLATASARQLSTGGRVVAHPTGIAETDVIQKVLAAASVKLRDRADGLKTANRTLEHRVAARNRELAASHALTKSILDNSPDTIEVLDDRGRFVFTNDKGYREHRAVELASGSKAEWPGLWPDESRPFAADALRRAQNGGNSRFTGCIPTPGGDPRWYDVLVTPMLGAHGTIRRILVVSRDITASHLHDQQLQEAKNRAEQASQGKADFLASMSHELRTPLNGILGYADLLTSDRQLSAGQRGRADRIQEAATGLLEIVNDILDLAKIEAGEMALRPQALLLRHEIDNALAVVMPLAQAKGLALSSELAPDLPACILADAERLRQILLNLLGNAVKFTGAGRICLSVRVRTDENGAGRLAFAVRDTGIGIPTALQPLLFRRFSQIDTSDERRFGGTGLGLAICRHLVERMGGTIEVESEAGHGSVFRFVVPFEPARIEDGTPRASAPVAAVSAQVLVVEDNTLNRGMIEQLLTAIGCSVDLVASGPEAIEAVQRRRYDLVLMDEQMPGMTGSTATRAVRALDHPARDVVIIGCSANVFAHDISRFEEAGMNGFVAKPLTRATLAAAIVRHLPERRIGVAADEGHFARDDGILQMLSGPQRGPALAELRRELRTLRGADVSADPGATARSAHHMISSAFLLQDSALATACQVFESVQRSGADLHPAFDHMIEAVDAAILQVEGLLTRTAARTTNGSLQTMPQKAWS